MPQQTRWPRSSLQSSLGRGKCGIHEESFRFPCLAHIQFFSLIQ
jgi:hypothetical protein